MSDLILEKDVEIGKVYRTPNGNHFLKVSDNHSVWVGNDIRDFNHISKGDSTVVDISQVCEVKVIGELKFY